MGKAEPQSPVPVLHHKRINVDSLQAAGEESVDLEIVKNPFQWDELNLEVEFDDLFDRNGEGSLLVELLQELLCTFP